MPIQTSRPTTFIKVKAKTDWSLVPAMPGHGRQIAIGLRRGEAGGVGEFRRADPGAGDAGRKMQRLRDQRQHEDHHDRPKDDRVMAIGASSFFAPTAPAMAMAPRRRTPRRPRPGRRERRSSPKPHRNEIDTRKVTIDTIDACKIATGPAQTIRVNGKVAPSSTMPILI